MKPLAFALAMFALILGTSAAPAEQPPQQIPTRPYEGLHTPPEAVASAAGGPAVVLTDQVKSTVVIQTIRGGPCGGRNYDRREVADSNLFGPQSNAPADSEPIGLWLPIGSGVAGVAGVLLIGFWLLRRSRV